MRDIVQDLRSIQEKYKNDIVSVGRISISEMAKGCADHIERLQSENTRLKAERDKAVEDLNGLRKKSGWKCEACYYSEDYERSICTGCGYNNDNNWKWRGLEESE